MHIEQGECRTIVPWLISQEKIIRLWIDEVITSPGRNDEMIALLEKHRCWLSERIHEINERVAA